MRASTWGNAGISIKANMMATVRASTELGMFLNAKLSVRFRARNSGVGRARPKVVVTIRMRVSVRP